MTLASFNYTGGMAFSLLCGSECLLVFSHFRSCENVLIIIIFNNCYLVHIIESRRVITAQHIKLNDLYIETLNVKT